MAKQHVEGLTAIHLNLLILFSPPVEGTPSAEEQSSIAQLAAFNDQKTGYAKIQAIRPQTIGCALTDSPVGEAAWIYEKFGEWTDTRHDPERALSLDEMLDNITLYWLTGTAASSARLSAESFYTDDTSTQKLDVPVGVSVFPGELYRPLKVWGERVYSKLFYWHEVSKGGHFAASSSQRSLSMRSALASQLSTAFSEAMSGITVMLMLEAARLIDAGSVEFAVDVGGASGALIHALKKQNLTLRGAVLVLPENSGEAVKAAEALGLQERLAIIGGDFFAEVPAAAAIDARAWIDPEVVKLAGLSEP
jgi:hypothetical protein